MIPQLSTVKSIDAVINQTAKELFRYVSPQILLVGAWDSHFDNITQLFQWAVYSQTLPGSFDSDIGLIVINRRSLLKQVVDRVSKNTAVLVYDEEHIIPIKERNLSHPNIICYLNNVSGRYLRGHIRTLLQLRKSLVSIQKDIPYVITDEQDRTTMTAVIRTLDMGVPCFVTTPNPEYFYHLFKEITRLSHYESAMYVREPDDFHAVIDPDPTTVVMQVDSEADFADYQQKPLDRFSQLYVSKRKNTCFKEKNTFDLPSIGASKGTYYLTGYFQSLKMNLADTEHRTRFVQVGDLNKFIEDCADITHLIEKLTQAFEKHSLRFRNIPIRIHDMYICNYPLYDLVNQFEKAVLNELLTQSSQSFEMAELVSGTNRITLINRSESE